jgi:hypothetical protein
MSRIRSGRAHPTAAMQLARHRGCLFPEDEIYGLMAASEVVVSPLYNIGVEIAWQTWWEEAIMSGHIMWTMLRTSTSDKKDRWRQGSNCIMPSSGFRLETFNLCGIEAGLRTYAPVKLHKGTVSVVGRSVGICKLDTYRQS